MKRIFIYVALFFYVAISAQNKNELNLKIDFIDGVKQDSINKIVNDDAITIFGIAKYKGYHYFFGQKKEARVEVYYRKAIIFLVKDNKVLSSVKTKYPHYGNYFARFKVQKFKGVDDALILIDEVEYETSYAVIFRKANKLLNVFETFEAYDGLDYKKISLSIPDNYPNQLWITRIKKGRIREEYDGDEIEVTYYNNIKKYDFVNDQLAIQKSDTPKCYYVTAISGLTARDAPSIFASKINKIPFGTKVKVRNRTQLTFTMGNGTELLKGNWVEIATNDEYDNDVYYVFDGFLSETPPNKDQEAITYANATKNKTGKWKWYYWDTTVNEEGYYKNGKKEGEWKWYNKRGALRAHGFYKNGKAEGEREWYSHYRTEGQYKDGKKIGEWKWYYFKQIRLSILFENDSIKRYSIYNNKGEILSEYQVKRNEKTSFDSEYGNMDRVWINTDSRYAYIDSENVIFENIENDKKIGIRKYYDLNDSFCKIKDEKDEKGNVIEKKYYKNGNLKSLVHYTGNDFNGKVDYFYENGTLSQTGSYINNNKSGIYKEFFENGQLKRSSYFINGKREGNLKMYYKNANLRYDLHYKNGLEDGIHKEYYKNGIIERITNYSNGKKDNKQQYFYKNGMLKKVTYYDKGIKKVQQENYYDNGNLARIDVLVKDNDSLILIERYQKDKTLLAVYYNTLQGKKTGIYKYYYDNGNLKYIINYKDGKEHGSYSYYYKNGNISSSGTNVANERVGVATFYNKNGTLRKKEYTEPDSPYVYTLAEWSYFPSGQLESKRTYEAGVKNSLKDAKSSIQNYYDNGQLLMEKKEVDEKVVKWNYYYKNGKLRETVLQEYGKRTRTIYHQNGKIYTIKITNYGKLIEIAPQKDKNGNLLAKGTFKAGNGIVNEYTSDGILLNIVVYVDAKIADTSFSIEDIWLDSSRLNSRAWKTYEKENDIVRLKQAILWVKQAIVINKNYFNTDTYAALLYKVGNYKKALKVANKAVKIAKKDKEDYKATEELIKKIEKKI